MKTTKLARATLTKATLVVLSIIFISLIFICLSSAVDPKNVAAVWLFDEGSGNVATDSSGNGNDGEFIGDPEWCDGVFDKALEFDGTNDVIEVPHSRELAITDEITITVWVKFFEFKDCGIISRSIDGGGDGDYFISQGCCAPGEKKVMFSISGLGSAAKGGDLKDDEWYHVAGTYDGAEVRTYVDGEVAGKAGRGGAIPDSNWPVLIGSYAGHGYKFHGILDDIAIFNAALEEDDIVKIMNEGLDVALGYAAVSPKEKLTTIWGKIKAEN